VNERRLEKTVELDASPEEVWAAIATGPGISAWFVPHELEPHEGGAITARFGGGMEGTSRVTGYEPGSRIAYGTTEQGPHAFEFLVEGRDGGGAVLRFVQSGFSGENWEDEYRGYDTGWDLFFLNLRAYLEHFAGQPVGNALAVGWTAGGATEIWPVLHKALGIDGHPAVGATVTLAPDGPPPVTGVVDVASPEFLGVRSANGLHRIGAEGENGCGLSAYHYFYGEPVDAAAITAAWQRWLTELFPAPAGAPAP